MRPPGVRSHARPRRRSRFFDERERHARVPPKKEKEKRGQAIRQDPSKVKKGTTTKGKKTRLRVWGAQGATSQIAMHRHDLHPAACRPLTHRSLTALGAMAFVLAAATWVGLIAAGAGAHSPSVSVVTRGARPLCDALATLFALGAATATVGLLLVEAGRARDDFAARAASGLVREATAAA